MIDCELEPINTNLSSLLISQFWIAGFQLLMSLLVTLNVTSFTSPGPNGISSNPRRTLDGLFLPPSCRYYSAFRQLDMSRKLSEVKMRQEMESKKVLLE